MSTPPIAMSIWDLFCYQRIGKEKGTAFLTEPT